MVAIPVSCNLVLHLNTLNELSATYLKTLVGSAHLLFQSWALKNHRIVGQSIPLSFQIPENWALGQAHRSWERKATFSAFTKACGKARGLVVLWEALALLDHLQALPFLPLAMHRGKQRGSGSLCLCSHWPGEVQEAAALGVWILT